MFLSKICLCSKAHSVYTAVWPQWETWTQSLHTGPYSQVWETLHTWSYHVGGCAQTCLGQIGDFWFFSHSGPLQRWRMDIFRPENLRLPALQVTKVSRITSPVHIEPIPRSWPGFSKIWENLNFCGQSVQKLIASTQQCDPSEKLWDSLDWRQCTLQPGLTKLLF